MSGLAVVGDQAYPDRKVPHRGSDLDGARPNQLGGGPMSESTELKHDPSCPYGDEFSLTAPEQCMPCAVIRKTRAACADTVASFDWSPETDDDDIRRLVASLRGTE